jgi:hypothetical protein
LFGQAGQKPKQLRAQPNGGIRVRPHPVARLPARPHRATVPRVAPPRGARPVSSPPASTLQPSPRASLCGLRPPRADAPRPAHSLSCRLLALELRQTDDAAHRRSSCWIHALAARPLPRGAAAGTCCQRQHLQYRYIL